MTFWFTFFIRTIVSRKRNWKFLPLTKIKSWPGGMAESMALILGVSSVSQIAKSTRSRGRPQRPKLIMACPPVLRCCPRSSHSLPLDMPEPCPCQVCCWRLHWRYPPLKWRLRSALGNLQLLKIMEGEVSQSWAVYGKRGPKAMQHSSY